MHFTGHALDRFILRFMIPRGIPYERGHHSARPLAARSYESGVMATAEEAARRINGYVIRPKKDIFFRTDGLSLGGVWVGLWVTNKQRNDELILTYLAPGDDFEAILNELDIPRLVAEFRRRTRRHRAKKQTAERQVPYGRAARIVFCKPLLLGWIQTSPGRWGANPARVVDGQTFVSADLHQQHLIPWTGHGKVAESVSVGDLIPMVSGTGQNAHRADFVVTRFSARDGFAVIHIEAGRDRQEILVPAFWVARSEGVGLPAPKRKQGGAC